MAIGNAHLWIVLSILALFGSGYNVLVGWLENNGHDRGYTAFLVVGGCLATILGATFLIGTESALIVFLCFAASGLPMTAGSMYRHAQREKAEERKAEGAALALLKCKEGGADD